MSSDDRNNPQFWLDYLRRDPAQHTSWLTYFRNALTYHGKTLEDYNTSEEELEKLRILGCKKNAEKWLEYLRRGSSEHQSFAKYLRQDAQEGGFTLEEIGTSEKELEKLRILGCKINAVKWLGILRGGHVSSSNRSIVGYLRREIQEGGLTLEEIGTDEDELRKFDFAAIAAK